MVKMIRKNTMKVPKRSRNTRGLRMKELTEATGLPKSAILHYVSQGLLPEPVRTSPNMAYYDPSCIERVEFIKTMQSTYSFPLNKIRMLLSCRDQGKDVAPLIELSGTIFGGVDGPTLNEAEFCRATGLTPEQIKELIKNKLLLPLEKNTFNQQDVTICGFYGRSFAMGARVADLAFYAEAAKMIVDKEMELRRRLTAHLPEDQDAELTRRLVLGARAVRNYVIDRTFQQRVASSVNLKDSSVLSGKGSKSKGGKNDCSI
jgi:DNA-binding transcriptional MerR regulator